MIVAGVELEQKHAANSVIASAMRRILFQPACGIWAALPLPMHLSIQIVLFCSSGSNASPAAAQRQCCTGVHVHMSNCCGPRAQNKA